ncbi:PREDICTED: proline-rich protein 23D1-like [Chrysochloris asiatica]|uniref:Proline-rich protein 23D1-like n=1 Tax=Chrysochloris asiatica TaxID=185453 RepID=A0A9B0WT35_CHRAS|nr:PREDICTED: proline-rich protein 23D1-like [Chrysochloris asiatica]
MAALTLCYHKENIHKENSKSFQPHHKESCEDTQNKSTSKEPEYTQLRTLPNWVRMSHPGGNGTSVTLKKTQLKSLASLRQRLDLHLHLRDEVLVLAPEIAMQLTLSLVTLVVVPEHVLRPPNSLLLPADALSPVSRRKAKSEDLGSFLQGVRSLSCSALQPLPHSLTPGPKICLRTHHGPHRKARRCLF